MKVSLKWLAEYVDLTEPAAQLAHRLTMAGTEVGSIQAVGSAWPGIVVGQVAKLAPHPNADRLLLATVDLGAETVTVVTGAPNLTAGAKVPFAPVGAQILDGHTGEPTVLKPARLRGIESRGMVCSEKELGLSEDHSGILILPPEAPIGRPVAEVLGDVILDIDPTPNRPDCLSVLGIAREVAALTAREVRLPPADYPEGDPPAADQVAVHIEAPDLCSRYCAAVIRGVEVGPSPSWLQARLRAVGLRPINTIVDITNYVMWEHGQPLHAFDYERVGGRRIVVRRARPGEGLVTLDGVQRSLGPEMLVIADATEAVALAGVMGGATSEVSEGTRTVLLESATFNRASIRRTSRALRLRTEASLRFDKGLPPAIAERALRRAVRLMAELAGGKPARGIVDAFPGRREAAAIPLAPGEVRRLLGVELTLDQIRAPLERLGFECRPAAGRLLVTPPGHRADVGIPADLVEEVARLVGYDQIPTSPLSGPVPDHPPQEILGLLDRVRDLLVGCGLQEVISYSLVGRRLLALAQADGAEPPLALRVQNPMTADQEYLRVSLRPSLLQEAARALRAEEGGLQIFEVGRVYLPRPGDLPEEREMLGILLAGPREPRGWNAATGPLDFSDLKGIVEELLARLKVEGIGFSPIEDPSLHPAKAAAILAGDARLGVLGEVHPVLVANFGFRVTPYLAELDLAALLSRWHPGDFRVAPLPRFPGVHRDLAFLVAVDAPAGALLAALREAGAPLLERAVLFDVYQGERLPPGMKSCAFALAYQAPERTLTDAEVDAVEGRIVAEMSRRFGARLRAAT